MSPRILIADDDPVQRQLLEGAVRRFGYAVEAAPGGKEALARINAPQAEKIDLVILDLVMPDLDGMGVLSALRGQAFAPKVIAQTTRASIEAAISALRAGAADFVVKPAGPERLMAAIKNALRLGALEAEIRRLDRQAGGVLSFKDIGSGPEMERAARLGERAARSAQPVLLEGEAGVGKRAIAQAIRAASDRRGRPFVTVECAAQLDQPIEQVLFGHEKGGFAGAGEKQPGKFVEAHGGSLFLGEVSALPLAAQARLLRALRDGEVDPVGARRPVRVDVRVIAATRRNLIELVKAGRFREDLYYRLNVHPISVPPLRQRRDEIAGLARGFCARFSAQEGKGLRGIAAEALNLLRAYDWPGNVRQLENAVYRAVALAEGDELTVAEFPQIAAQVQGFEVRIPAAPLPCLADREAEAGAALLRDPNVMALLDENGDVRRLDHLEADAIRFALIHYRGRMSMMARKLGVGRSTLYRKMKEYGVAGAAEEGPVDPREAGGAGRSDAAA